MEKISIIGCGGVGGYFGGLIARKNPDRDVFFIARGEHLKKIRENGLILNKGEQTGLVCRPTLATDEFKQLPQCDLIIVAVKGYDLDNALENAASIIKENSIILPLLNGVDIYDRIRDKLSIGTILPACVYVGTHIEKPGTITQKGGDARIVFGNDPENKNADLSALQDLLRGSDIDYSYSDNPFPAIWTKFMFIAAFGLVTAGHSKSLGQVLENVELLDKTRAVMLEINQIAAKKGILLPADIVESSLRKGETFPYETKTSYQRDIEKKGKNDEGDLFGGTIIKLGKQLKVDTSVTEELYNKINNLKE